MQELARGWKEDAETLPWLKERARSDEDEDVRSAAVQELARGWKEDAETLPAAEGTRHAPMQTRLCGVRRCRSWRGAGRRMPRPCHG